MICVGGDWGMANAADAQHKVLSVILPVYNAMPWLPIAVRDMLKQDLGGEGIEVICCDDASSDGSFACLDELAGLLGARAVTELCDPPASAPRSKRTRVDDGAGSVTSTNPALVNMPLRATETADHPSFRDQEEPEDVRRLRDNPVTASEVVAAARPEHQLRVLSWRDGVNRGQGAAMTLCLSRVTTPFLAQMESDDEREDPRALAKLLSHLRCDAGIAGASCLLKTIGWERPGMQRYVDWQNSCVTEAEMSKGRFIEIPALHQTALFRTQAVLEVTGGVYRDGTADGEDDLDVPVDMWFWLSFFHAGKRCSKLPETLFGWRQHPRQHTRTHGRLSIDNLRKIKVHFLVRPGGPAHGRAVEVWSVGKSLEEWRAALSAHSNAPSSLVTVSWKPGMLVPKREEAKGIEPKASDDIQDRHHSAPGSSVTTSPGNAVGTVVSEAVILEERPVRLFVFGMEKARRGVRQQIRDWDDHFDWFVA